MDWITVARMKFKRRTHSTNFGVQNRTIIHCPVQGNIIICMGHLYQGVTLDTILFY